MKKILQVFIIFLVLIVSLPGTSFPSDRMIEDKVDHSTTQKKIKLSELIEYAAKHNPDIEAARLRWESTQKRYPQAVSLKDPVLKFTQPVEEIETRLGPQRRIISFSQQFPFPGELKLKGEIVKKEIEIALIEYENVLRDIITEVKKSFYELFYIDRAIKLAEEDKTVLDYFFDVSKANYGLAVSELDELVRAEKLSARASSEIIILKEIRKDIVARLNALLNRDPEYPIGELEEPIFQEFHYTRKDLYRWAIDNYEKIRIAGLNIEKSKLLKTLSNYTYYPDFLLGINYAEIGESPISIPESGRDALSITFGVTIPLWLSKNRATVEEAEINLRKSLTEKESIVNKIEKKVKSIYHNLVRAKEVAKLYGNTLVPEAKESVEFAEARYKTGEEHLGRLLETQSMWIQFRLAYYRAFSDYLKSVADLERLTGKELYSGRTQHKEDNP